VVPPVVPPEPSPASPLEPPVVAGLPPLPPLPPEPLPAEPPLPLLPPASTGESSSPPQAFTKSGSAPSIATAKERYVFMSNLQFDGGHSSRTVALRCAFGNFCVSD